MLEEPLEHDVSHRNQYKFRRLDEFPSTDDDHSLTAYCLFATPQSSTDHDSKIDHQPRGTKAHNPASTVTVPYVGQASETPRSYGNARY